MHLCHCLICLPYLSSHGHGDETTPVDRRPRWLTVRQPRTRDDPPAGRVAWKRARVPATMHACAEPDSACMVPAGARARTQQSTHTAPQVVVVVSTTSLGVAVADWPYASVAGVSPPLLCTFLRSLATAWPGRPALMMMLDAYLIGLLLCFCRPTGCPVSGVLDALLLPSTQVARTKNHSPGRGGAQKISSSCLSAVPGANAMLAAGAISG